MIITSKYKDPLENFVCHGMKTSGSYNYVLLIDETGQTLIERIKTDNTEILFTRKADATDITAYWAADFTAYSYTYLHLVTVS